MIDICRWADSASEKAFSLREQGFDAEFTFTEASQSSSNPSFFVDINNDATMARIIFWSTGDFDLSVYKGGSYDPTPISNLPRMATDENFEVILGIFVNHVTA